MSTSVTSVVNHFPSAENGFTTTTSGSVSSGATTVGLNSVAGYTNGETAVFVIDPTDATKKQTFTGTIDTAGVQVTGVVWTAGTNQTHSAGATVVDYATATHISMMTKGLLVEHNQTGTHKAGFLVPSYVDATFRGGWRTISDSWTFSSWDSTNKTGVITIPTNGTTVYSLGMKIRISQSTGGTKYGFVTKIAATAMTVYFGTDYTLDNEAISSPHYSIERAPYGFPMDPDKWTVSVTSTSDRTTTSTTYATLTDAITVPIGVWRLWYKATIYITIASTPASRRYCHLILTAGSSEDDINLTTTVGSRIPGAANNDVEAPAFAQTTKAITTATTYTFYGKVSTTGPGPTLTLSGATNTTVIKAVCVYL